MDALRKDALERSVYRELSPVSPRGLRLKTGIKAGNTGTMGPPELSCTTEGNLMICRDSAGNVVSVASGATTGN